MIMFRSKFIIILSITLFSNALFAVEKLADPTLPANYKQHTYIASAEQEISTAMPYEWVLNTTIVSPYQKIAIINGQQLKVGEEINGAKIILISHQHVVLSFNNKKIDLLLQRSFISEVNAARTK